MTTIPANGSPSSREPGRGAMSSVARRWLGNSTANLIGGGSAAAFNLVLPAIVSRHLATTEFAAWSLALQIVAYITLLGLGLQTATARAVAQAEGRQDVAAMLQIARAAHSIARWATLAAALAALLLAAAYPLLFPGMDGQLLGTFRLVVLLIGLSTATQLMALVPMGVFQGLHRNIVFVGAQVAVRVLAVALVWAGARAGVALLGLAGLLAASSALLWPTVRGLMGGLLPWSRDIATTPLDRGRRRELLDYCASLSVWGVATLVVNSVGVLMVGHVAFEQTGVYSLAMSASTVLAGLLGAVFSPLVTTAAALHAQPERRAALPRLLLKSTAWCAGLLGLLYLACMVFVRDIIALWVGPAFVAPLTPLLLMLVGAHALRNLGTPYAMMLLATGLHRRALLTGAGEGVCNLVATVLLGRSFGVIGIAAGTLVGAVAGLLGALVFNTRRTPELTPRPLRFALAGFVLPLIVFLPLALLVVQWKSLP
jgi:O-antigen/teichoic acid export membrane protein